jgi:hypothetical protein
MKKLAIPPEGNGKKFKKSILNLKKWEMKKIEICHKNLKIFILK